MDRRKNLLPIWLAVAPIIIGTALALWQFPPAAGKAPGQLPDGQCTPQIKPSPRARQTQASKTRLDNESLPPRLLPRGLLPRTETCQFQITRPSDSIQAGDPIQVGDPVKVGDPIQAGDPVQQNPPQEQVFQTAFPTSTNHTPTNHTSTKKENTEKSGPRYSWLLEGQAGVPADSGRRSFRLERIAREADIHTRRGFSLANRGAYYSARGEFVKSLRLVAQGLDVEHQTSVHGRALRAGLTALKEADDFIPSGSQLETDLDFQAIINAHRTPVLKLSQPRALTSLQALSRYFGFAQYQLAIASGREIAGSMALHAMAKLYASSIDNATVNVLSAKPKAMTCFQAAMISYPQNYMASNDLGVLLANSGRLEDARNVLESSIKSYPHSTSWRNLAEVYRQLDLPKLAQGARLNQQQSSQLELARRGAVTPGECDTRVCWLSPEEFAKTYAQAADARRPLPVQKPSAVPQARQAAKNRTQAKPGPLAAKTPLIESKKTTSWSWNILKKAFK